MTNKHFSSRKLRIEAQINGRFRIERVDSHQISTLCHVTRRTAQRWIDAGELPPWARELIEYKHMGRVRDTDRQRLEAMTYKYQEASALWQRLADLERDNARLKDLVEFWRTRAGAPRAANDER